MVTKSKKTGAKKGRVKVGKLKLNSVPSPSRTDTYRRMRADASVKTHFPFVIFHFSFRHFSWIPFGDA